MPMYCTLINSMIHYYDTYYQENDECYSFILCDKRDGKCSIVARIVAK